MTTSTRRFDPFNKQQYLGWMGDGGFWRVARFGFMGTVTFFLQIGLLMLLTNAGLNSVIAYAIALAVAVQFNFTVNQLFVWDDRPISALFSRAMVERWVTFHGCIAVSLVLNFVGFAVAQLFIPDVAAAVFGVAVSTLVKFLSLDRLAFKVVS